MNKNTDADRVVRVLESHGIHRDDIIYGDDLADSDDTAVHVVYGSIRVAIDNADKINALLPGWEVEIRTDSTEAGPGWRDSKGRSVRIVRR
jgi:hypothetical protein